MAKSYEFPMYAHPSVYGETNQDRKMNIYFSEPENGVNEHTGIALFIAGFGGHAKSKVYTKMRNQFADKYNLITVQCDYFGWQFMQDKDVEYDFCLEETDMGNTFSEEQLDSILNDGDLEVTVPCKARLDESVADFNDMGIMQAVDNITAVLAVMAILNDNKLEFNKEKIMIYGNSHGAYLAYLCNAFAPQLFSMIIDNSAYIEPEYRGNRFVRMLDYNSGKITFRIMFDYLAKRLPYDNDIVSVPFLYKQFENKCNIVSFHGVADRFDNFMQKKQFCSDTKNIIFNEISEEKIDGEIIKSTEHGLDADYLKFFEFVVENYSQGINRLQAEPLSVVNYKTEKNLYHIDYSTGLPMVRIEKAY